MHFQRCKIQKEKSCKLFSLFARLDATRRMSAIVCEIVLFILSYILLSGTRASVCVKDGCDGDGTRAKTERGYTG